MNNGIERIRQSRINLLKLIENLTTEELNKIPPGFNNNVIWNLGHLIAAQQRICYLRNGVKPFIDETFLTQYNPGTKPDGYVSESDVAEIKELFLDSIDQFGKDYEAGMFSADTAWTSGYGIEIANIDDAINYDLFHEGLHRGYIMAMKRML